jgi:hypothetical protein
MTKNKFVIFTGGYPVNWAPKFNTRREAQAWIWEDHDWEERTEVQFQGNSAFDACSKCGSYTKVDDLSGEKDFSAVWLCVECQ